MHHRRRCLSPTLDPAELPPLTHRRPVLAYHLPQLRRPNSCHHRLSFGPNVGIKVEEGI
jgi:hypothetical protein